MTDRAVAGYYRISVAREDMKAPELYTDEIERYCNYKHLRLGKVFVDIDRSGFRGAAPRPALEELVRRRLEFSAVIVPKLARFGRSMKDLVELFDLFDRDNVSLVFLDMNIDTSTSQGRLLRHIMAAFAEYESDVKADYARANHRMVAIQGRPWGGRPPFGYLRHPSRRSFLIDNEHAPIVTEIFDRYEAGQSQWRIACDLNDQGKRRPSGSAWTTQHIGRIIDNPAYAALCLVDDSFVTAVWEPLIERERWERLRAKRAVRSHEVRSQRGAKAGPYLLSGLLRCGACGAKFVHRSRRDPRQRVYVCGGGQLRNHCGGGQTNAARAERFVTEAFLARIRFAYMDSNGELVAGAADRRASWDAASVAERRRLLAAAIEQVVVIPHAEGSTRRGPRKLNIVWGEEAQADVPLTVVAQPGRTPAVGRVVSEGRAEAVRELSKREREDASQRRSERARAHAREWRAAGRLPGKNGPKGRQNQR